MGILHGLLLILLSSPLAAAALSLQVQPLWNGFLKPGHASELQLILQSERNGRVEISIPEHRPALVFQAELQAFRPLALPVAVRPGSTAPLRIEVHMAAGGQAATEVRFSALSPATRLLATTRPLPEHSLPGRFLLTIPPDGLPRTAEGYDAIDQLLLDGDGFDRLDAAQRTQLLDYSARCGAVLLTGAANPGWEALRRIAGCGGRFLTRAGTADDLVDRLRQPSGFRPPLPDSRQLEDLLPQASHATWMRLLWFFVLYALALLLFSSGYARALGVPMVAALLAWLAWSGDTAQRQLASWSEIRSGDHQLRYAALLRLTGEGRGSNRTPLPPDLGLLRDTGTAGDAELWRSRSDDRLVLVNEQRLLARRSFHTQGSLPWTPALHLTLQARGPVVENRGAEPSPAALLGWDGQRHPVPSLPPGAHWTPPPESTAWQLARGAEQRLRRRTQDGGAALLLPHHLLPEQGGEPPIEEQGWLLITQG